MHILKKSALGACVSLLTVFLFTFGLAFGIYRILGSPDTIKDALKESGFYQSVAGDVLDQAQKDGTEGAQNDIPLGRPEVQKVIKDAASPELLQAQAENVLDSVYAWLQGDTAKLGFTVELGEAKTRLGNGMAQYIEQRLSSLAPCKGPSPSGEFDPFNATCLPKGVTPGQAAAEAKNEILKGEFLKETTLTAEDVKTDGGRTLEQQLQAAPKAYQGVKWAVYGSGLLAVLLAAAVVFLSANWRSGLKKVSIIFIFVGVSAAVAGWAVSYGIGRVSGLAKEPLQKSGVEIGRYLANDLRNWWLWFGVTLVVLGVGALVALRFTRPKTVPGAGLPEKPGETTGGSPPAEKSPAPKTGPVIGPKQKPKPAKKLVQ